MSQTVQPQRILFVCTANICRSATAEYVARKNVGSGGWTFRSAGFLPSGRSPSQQLVRALDEFDIDVRSHRSYKIDVASLEAADLVLTMEGEHIRKATAVWPQVLAKIVPLKQAVLLAESALAAPVTVPEFLRLVQEQRDPADYLDSRWDVDDPFGRSIRIYRRSVAEISTLVKTLMAVLRQ